MDAFTHALAGSLAADLLPWTRKLGPKAQMAAALAGMAPDLDMAPAFVANFPPSELSFHGLFDRELVMLYHRAYTHSLFFTFLGAVLLAALARALGAGSWRRWFPVLWLALLSHILLDYTNPWGVRALLPFDGERYALGLMPFIDPLFTGLLALGFILNHVLRDPFRKPEDPPLRPAWRQRSAAGIDRLAGVGTVAGTIVVLLFLRVWLTRYGVFPSPVLLS